MENIRICSSHRDYEVPLIWTFSWNNYEYWCPYCDEHEGALGAGEIVEETEVLKKRLELYKKATKEYVHAMGVAVCVSTLWEGEQTKPKDLPEKEKERLKKIREKGWKLNKKIEDLE